MLLPKM